MRIPSEAELRELVRKALHSGQPLDRAVGAFIFGRYKKAEPVWPPKARDVWSEAVRLWLLERPIRIEKMARAAGRAEDLPTLEESWVIVQEFSPDPIRWWEVPGLTWPQLARRIEAGARVAQYHFRDVHGWSFIGSGSAREVAYAPCVVCREPVAVDELDTRICGPCRRRV